MKRTLATHRRTIPASTGNQIIKGLSGLRDALAEGNKLPDRFTMRTVELRLEPRDWTPSQIRSLRKGLRASQSVFAQLIGASPKTVQAWEQGNTPPPMARRLLECIEKDPATWEKMLHDAALTARN